jgi:hypothetical protein
MSSVNENEVKSIFRHADLKEFITSSSELQKKKKKDKGRSPSGRRKMPDRTLHLWKGAKA